jgi:hypothetical protein
VDAIEVFLRTALQQRRVEDRQIRAALASLRPVLSDVDRIIRESGALEPGPARERIIRAVSDVIARQVRDQWGIPMLASLQDELSPFVEQQMGQARRLVEAAGGTLTNPGAAVVNVPAIVNGVIVNGRPLGEQLTSSLPASIADRAERYIRLGLNDPGVEATFETAVRTTAENAVEATIRSGVHSVGSAAQQAIYQFETDPDWLQGRFTWTAVLDSRTCPVCVGQDGTERRQGEAGAFWDGQRKIDPHLNCRCYLIPSTWRGEDNRRIVVGDSGEQVVPFRTDVEGWIRQNPDTAAEIFGKARAKRLIDGEISLDRAVREAT